MAITKKESDRRYYLKNKDRINKRNREWKKQNPELVVAARKKDIAGNRKSSDNWRKNNPGKNAAQTAAYKAAKLQRIPLWADMEAIEAFYDARPEGHHVDHIIPIQGDDVSGLHVLKNLQYLPVEENLKKGNNWKVDRVV